MVFFGNSTNEQLTDRLADHLSAIRVGEIITHETITTILAGAKPTAVGALLQAARRRANVATGALFKSVRGVGYMRLADGEAPAVGFSGLLRIRSAAKSVTRTITNTVLRSNSMTDQQVLRTTAVASTLGLIGRQTYKRNVDAKETELIAEHDGSTASAARDSLEKMRAKMRRRR